MPLAPSSSTLSSTNTVMQPLHNVLDRLPTVPRPLLRWHHRRRLLRPVPRPSWLHAHPPRPPQPPNYLLQRLVLVVVLRVYVPCFMGRVRLCRRAWTCRACRLESFLNAEGIFGKLASNSFADWYVLACHLSTCMLCSSFSFSSFVLSSPLPFI